MGMARMREYDVARERAIVMAFRSPADLHLLTFTNKVLQRAVLTNNANTVNVQHTPKTPTSETGMKYAIISGFILSKRVVQNVDRNAQLEKEKILLTWDQWNFFNW